MDLKKIANNRFVVIIIVAAVLIGYTYFQGSRTRIERRADAKRPRFLTMEFAEQQTAAAEPGAVETAHRLLVDADMYMKSRDFRSAGSAYHRALALYPDGKGYFRYGIYLYRMKKTAWALDSFDLAEALEYPKDEIDYQRAVMHGDMRKPFEALEYLASAMESGNYSVDQIESEQSFEIIRKSVITKSDYAALIADYR